MTTPEEKQTNQPAEETNNSNTTSNTEKSSSEFDEHMKIDEEGNEVEAKDV